VGATGQVGQALARAWPAQAPRGIWQHRTQARADVIARFPGAPLHWDILDTPAPPLPRGITSMIVLAAVLGTTDEAALARNTDIALACVKAARAAGIARVLIASTQAVYGTDTPRVHEDSPCTPLSPYARAKYAVERAVADTPGVTCLRLGNVAGADMLLRNAARQPCVTLDRFADGRTPRRSYIGPVTLARVLGHLCDPALVLPRVLNVANPGVLEMDAVMAAAQVTTAYRPAPDTALPVLELDTARLNALLPLPRVAAQPLIAEARAGGWQPHS